jgi:peptide/nickel transport system substrate-binding protein
MRIATLGTALLRAFTLITPADVLAQTKDDTGVYVLQSDIQTWDPPSSVLRESVILGYNVFDHLAARDLKTGKVGPSLAVSWKNVDETTWEVKLRSGVKFHDGTPFGAKDVKATSDGPYTVFVERLTARVMMSEKAIREKGHEWLQDNPVGTGPYKLVK